MSDFTSQASIPVIPDFQGQSQEQDRLSRQQRREHCRDSRCNERNNIARRQFEQQERLIERLDAIKVQLSILISKVPDARPVVPVAEQEPSIPDYAAFDFSGLRNPTPAPTTTTQQDTTTTTTDSVYPPPSELPEEDGLYTPPYPESRSPSIYKWPACYDYTDDLMDVEAAESQNNIRGGDNRTSSHHHSETAGSSSSPPEPSPVAIGVNEAAATATTTTPEMLRLLASTFYLLELDLLETRRRLQDLRDAAPRPHAALASVREAVRTIADGLESAIDQDLDRLFFLRAVQERAGLRGPVSVSVSVPEGSSAAAAAAAGTARVSRVSAAAITPAAAAAAAAGRPSISSPPVPPAVQIRHLWGNNNYPGLTKEAGRNNTNTGTNNNNNNNNGRISPRRHAYIIPAARPRYGGSDSVSLNHDGWSYVNSDPDWSVFDGEPITPVAAATVPSTIAGGGGAHRFSRAERQQQHEMKRTLPHHRSRYVPLVL